MTALPTVVVHFDENGELNYLVSGADVRVLIVDDRTATDRVYEWTTVCGPEAIAALLGADAVGSQHDARHAAIAASINELVDGVPRLSLVRQ